MAIFRRTKVHRHKVRHHKSVLGRRRYRQLCQLIPPIFCQQLWVDHTWFYLHLEPILKCIFRIQLQRYLMNYLQRLYYQKRLELCQLYNHQLAPYKETPTRACIITIILYCKFYVQSSLSAVKLRCCIRVWILEQKLEDETSCICRTALAGIIIPRINWIHCFSKWCTHVPLAVTVFCMYK